MQDERSKVLRTTSAAAAAALWCSAVNAHHSSAAIDTSSEISIRGTVSELQWSNPHVGLTLEVLDENGVAQFQEIELVAVSEALALGLRREDLKPGTTVIVQANPGRSSPGSRVLGQGIRTPDGTILLPGFGEDALSAGADLVEAESLSGRWVPVTEDFLATPEVMVSWKYKDDGGDAVKRAFSKFGATLGICEALPPPILTYFPEMREIEVSDDFVSMRFEAQGVAVERTVRLDLSSHPEGVLPTVMGHSIGWWEGDTLVIDTIAFEQHFVGVAAGVPSGPDKHLVERLTLTDDRKHIRYEYELDDPSVLSEPAKHAMLWNHRPDLEFSKVPCDPETAVRLLR